MFRLTDKEIEEARFSLMTYNSWGYGWLYSKVAEYVDKYFGHMAEDVKEEITEDLSSYIYAFRRCKKA